MSSHSLVPNIEYEETHEEKCSKWVEKLAIELIKSQTLLITHKNGDYREHFDTSAGIHQRLNDNTAFLAGFEQCRLKAVS